MSQHQNVRQEKTVRQVREAQTTEELLTEALLSELPHTLSGMPQLNKDKFELLRYVTELAEKESDRAWVRYNVMLTITGGIFVLLTFAWGTHNPLIVAAVTILGVFISYTWYQINRWSYYYEHRWHADMEEIIRSERFLSEWVRGRTASRIERPGKAGWPFFHWLPRILLVFWSILFVTCLLSYQLEVFKQIFQ
jgi:hypothetical protein